MPCSSNNSSEKPASAYSLVFPPKAQWTSNDVPDLSGQTIIVTGGSSGIGKETCRVLLVHGARVYIAARSAEKAFQAIQDLRYLTNNDQCFFLKLDLADLSQIREAVNDFLSKENQLHVLFNNGGIMTPPIELLTEQGYDAQFGTNLLGHFFFTKLLLPVMITTARSSHSRTARIVNTSSDAADVMTIPEGINFESLQRGEAASRIRHKLGAQKLYGQSKLATNMISIEMAKRYGDQGIFCFYLHPGYIQTDLQRHMPAVARKIAYATVFKPVEDGAITQLYAGTSPDALKTNGQYFVPWARPTVPRNSQTWNQALATKVWDWCEAQTAPF